MEDFKQDRIVFSVPGMEAVPVHKGIDYKSVANQTLQMDIYFPAGHKPEDHLPAMLFIHGEAPPEVLFDAKDWGQYVSWGQLAASAGMVAITFNHRSSRWFQRMDDVIEDIRDCWDNLMANGPALGIDIKRIGVWVCSGGTPAALSYLLGAVPAGLSCLTACYGRMDLTSIASQLEPAKTPAKLQKYSATDRIAKLAHNECPPLLIVRCGGDQLEGVNRSIDAFCQAALQSNIPLELINHPTAEHAFDVVNDDAISKRIIQRIIAFNQAHLIT